MKEWMDERMGMNEIMNGWMNDTLTQMSISLTSDVAVR